MSGRKKKFSFVSNCLLFQFSFAFSQRWVVKRGGRKVCTVGGHVNRGGEGAKTADGNKKKKVKRF